jgi:hypothetical protein
MLSPKADQRINLICKIPFFPSEELLSPLKYCYCMLERMTALCTALLPKRSPPGITIVGGVAGTEAWPPGCALHYIAGVMFGSRDRVMVGALQPGEHADISIHMTSPHTLGMHEGQWRMQMPTGMYFGGTCLYFREQYINEASVSLSAVWQSTMHTIQFTHRTIHTVHVADIVWVIVQVEEHGLLGVTQQLSNIGSSEFGQSHASQHTNPFGSPVKTESIFPGQVSPVMSSSK